MAYSEEKKTELFELILSEISNGNSLRKTLEIYDMPSSSTFYQWLEESEEKSKRYARACELRSEIIFEEILEIADKQDADVFEVDGIEMTNHNVIARSRLQVDARKWILSKMNPKKYGDKVDLTTGGEKLPPSSNVIEVEIIRRKED